jgi:PAS domain-containing protein
MIKIEGPGGLGGLPFSTTKTILRFGDKESLFFEGRGMSEEYGEKFLPFVCGYGAGRYGIGPDSGRSYRIADSVTTLFRYEETLIDPELTLRRLESLLGTEVYSRTIRGLKRALGLSQEDSIELRPSGGIVLSGPTVGGHVPLEGWADGYRLTFSWILDLYAWALRAGSLDEEGHIEGILLVDEIEQHLHPSMQAEILPRLSELLPKMQIFVTTHSPLVALDAKPEELVVLRRDGDRVVAEDHVPDFSGYSAEDMLSDPRLFDTEVYGSETREKLSEYHALASVPKEERSPEQRRQLRSLATEISSLEGPRERENETSRLLKELMAKYGL